MRTARSMSSQTGMAAAAVRTRALQSTPRRVELEQRLATLQNDHAALHAALFEASQVHRRLCAPRRMRFGDFQVASEIFAVRQLPGDFFIVHEDDRAVMVALGDVCGKGLEAGMWVTHVAGLIAMHYAADPRPQSVTARVNRDFQHLPGMPLTTLFQARLDPVTGIMEFCNAGHPPAYVLRHSRAVEELSAGGPLLGAFPKNDFSQASIRLEAGDVVVLYSDGILESANAFGEQFGHERWEALVRTVDTTDADAMLLSLLGAVQDFTGGRPLADDMSLAVIRRHHRGPRRHPC